MEMQRPQFTDPSAQTSPISDGAESRSSQDRDYTKDAGYSFGG